MRSAVRQGGGVALISVTCVVCAAMTAIALAMMVPAGAASPRGGPRGRVDSQVSTAQRHRMAACVQAEDWSPTAGLPCPPAPYTPGDFVYTCAWIESHPAEAAEARVSCETK